MEQIEIKLYKAEYKEDFIRLNTEWITTFFRLEDSDIYTLNHVEEYIIDQGGQVFFALVDGQVKGCCSLIHHPEEDTYELAKMAVSPSVQGLGLGRKLGETIIEYAKSKGIKQIFLEGNTQLKASIILYRKLGFEEVSISHAAYDRCNIMMKLKL